MPRRPKGGRGKAAKGPRPVNREDGKMKKWNKASDIPLDEEDEFHVNRDKILLNGDDPNLDDDGDEDEVFALKGIPESASSGEEDQEEEDDEEEEEPEAPKQRHKKATKGKRQDASDDEPSASEEEEETWGSKKSAYYSTNAAHFDSEDEEANELEEQEAKRLQTKTRDTLADDDFGLADPVELASQEQIHDPTEPATQPLPQDKRSLLKHLEKTSPETLALARDWDDIARSVIKAGEKVKKMESEAPDSLSLGMVHLHYQTLLTYATTLAFYLHLRSNTKYATQPELLNTHPILARLLTLKQSLATLEDLDFDMSDDSQEGGDSDEFDLYDEDDEDLDVDMDAEEDSGGFAFDSSGMRRIGRKKKRLEMDELAELLKDAEADLQDLEQEVSPKPKKTQAKKAEPAPEAEERPKKKRKSDTATEPVFDLVEPEFEHSSSTPVASTSGELDAFGEQTSLHNADAEDKKARKKSLRFHTSRIESAAGRRERGAKNLLGGDDDIPYKERKKQKEIREAKELARKGLGTGGDDLDDSEPALQGKRKRAEDDGDEDGSGGEEDADGYYSLVQKKSKEQKEQKKTEYEATRAAEREELVSIDTSDGPRGLTNAILKNRGLTPHRSKSVRNPRVKKRQKFEKAKKKIGSQKAVYKGGVGESGRYDGEKTGISKVVKAVRL